MIGMHGSRSEGKGISTNSLDGPRQGAEIAGILDTFCENQHAIRLNGDRLTTAARQPADR